MDAENVTARLEDERVLLEEDEHDKQARISEYLDIFNLPHRC